MGAFNTGGLLFARKINLRNLAGIIDYYCMFALVHDDCMFLLHSIDCYKNALGEQGAISGWKEEAVSGRQAPTAGQHGSLSGRQAPAAGQHGLLSGRQAPAAGQHGLLSGRQAPTTGQHGLLSGRQAPAAGQAGLEQWRRAVEHCGNAWNELGVYYLHIAAAMDYEKG